MVFRFCQVIYSVYTKQNTKMDGNKNVKCVQNNVSDLFRKMENNRSIVNLQKTLIKDIPFKKKII